MQKVSCVGFNIARILADKVSYQIHHTYSKTLQTHNIKYTRYARLYKHCSFVLCFRYVKLSFVIITNLVDACDNILLPTTMA